MNGRVSKQLRAIAPRLGFTGPALKRLRGRMKDEWNAIPRNERGRVDALELIARATGVRWREHPDGGEEA